MLDPSSQKPKPLSTPKSQSLLESKHRLSSQIVEGLIREGDLVIFSGPYWTGKTPVLTQLAVCVATGVPWLGREVASRRVVALDFETRPGDWQQTALAICDRLDVPVPNAMELDVRCNLDRPIIPPEVGRLMAPRIELLRALLRNSPKAFITVDPADYLFDSVEKNRSTDIIGLYTTLKALLREYPRAAMVLVFGLRKRARLNDPHPDLLVDPRGWLEETSGCAEIMTRADLRLGIDRHVEDDSIRIIHGIGKRRRVSPIFFKELEDPTRGFEELDRGHLLAAVFGEREVQWWLSLPERFRWKDAATTEIDDQRISTSSLQRLLKKAAAAGLLKPKPGHWYRKDTYQPRSSS